MNSRRTTEPRYRSSPQIEQDEEVVGRYEKITNDDIAELYRESALWVEQWLGQKFNALPRQEITDIVIDSFVKIAEKGQAGEIYNLHENSLRALLRKIAYHKAIDSVRRMQRIREDELLSEGVEPHFSEDSVMMQSYRAHTPELVLLQQEEDQETSRIVDIALRTPNLLNADQRIVLEKRYIQGVSQRELAAELQVPIGTVMSREHYALEKIRRHFRIENTARRAPRTKTRGNGNASIIAAK